MVEERRAEALARTASVLSREGLAGVPANVLAKAMFQSVGGLYRAFGSKEAVARAVVTHLDELLFEHLGLAAIPLNGAEDFRALLLGLWSAVLAFAATEADLFAYAHLHWRHPDGRERTIDPQSTRCAALLEALLAKGMACGQLRTQPPAVARALVWGVLVQLVKERAAGAPCDPEQTFDTVWRALAATEGRSSPPDPAVRY